MILIDSQIQPGPQYEYFKNSILPLFDKYRSMKLVVFSHKIDNANIGQNDYNK